MIDTSKYEGHTPAPWEIHGDRICAQATCTPLNVGGNIATVAHKGVLSDNEADKQLIADAPLLLEEVKRLHVEVRALRKAQGYDMKFPVEVLAIDELMSENRQLRKENRQLRALFDSSNTVDGDD